MTTKSNMEWQPIETAPKDGTVLILGIISPAVNLVRDGYWSDGEEWEHSGFDSQDECRGWWAYTSSCGAEKLTGLYAPTYWMFLPEPPEDRGDE
jgi:hypothetical protein